LNCQGYFWIFKKSTPKNKLVLFIDRYRLKKKKNYTRLV
jgi:hypothetical protein